jgi:hypothetical protein
MEKWLYGKLGYLLNISLLEQHHGIFSNDILLVMEITQFMKAN